MTENENSKGQKITHISTPNEKQAAHFATSVLPRVVTFVLIIIIGIVGMIFLSSLRKAPAHVDAKENAISVTTIEVNPENVPVSIVGYGQARSRDVVSIAPEVPGNVVAIHPQLELGCLIAKGDVLLQVDDRNYKAALQQAQAQTTQAKDLIERLKRQFAIDKDRLGTMRRTRELAMNDFDRARTLFTEDQVGTQSGVDRVEMSFNQADDALDQMQQAIELYPIRIREAESGLQAMEAGLELAQANMDRTAIRAPFTARVKQVQVEEGQYISPGKPVMTLADDSLLEISVPLDSRDAKSWLQFKNGGTTQDSAWFGELEPVECTVYWTESPETHQWKGTLERVQQFDQMTRTVIVAVRVNAQSAAGAVGHLPLVDGMFCEVAIPGQTMQNVYRLPNTAVSYDGVVLLAVDNHIKRLKVDVVRSQGEFSFVAEGLKSGDKVITTRLVNPQPNALLRILEDDSAQNETVIPESAS